MKLKDVEVLKIIDAIKSLNCDSQFQEERDSYYLGKYQALCSILVDVLVEKD